MPGEAAAGAFGSCEATASDVDALLSERGVAVVTQAGWEAIDEAERARSEPQGRPARQADVMGQAARGIPWADSLRGRDRGKAAMGR